LLVELRKLRKLVPLLVEGVQHLLGILGILPVFNLLRAYQRLTLLSVVQGSIERRLVIHIASVGTAVRRPGHFGPGLGSEGRAYTPPAWFDVANVRMAVVEHLAEVDGVLSVDVVGGDAPIVLNDRGRILGLIESRRLGLRYHSLTHSFSTGG
jgi:hypothetical protein